MPSSFGRVRFYLPRCCIPSQAESAELDDILNLGREPPTLQQLDSTLKRYLDLCATYHGTYVDMVRL